MSLARRVAAILHLPERLRNGGTCPACGKPILIEQPAVMYRRRPHHESCVRYRRRQR